MKLELVSIPTDTEQPLDGLYYEPADGTLRGSALLFHGHCMNFYVGALRFLPPMLTALGFACLAFNRRGHDILSTRNSRVPEGAAYETSAEMIADNRIAAEWLSRVKGHHTPVIIGHSNGGMLAAQHCADHPDTPGLVLLSAHAGGRSIIEDASKTGLLAGDRFEEISAQAKDMVENGRGGELMLLPGWWRVITAASYVDILGGLPDILENARHISCPSLYLRGDREPPQLYPMEEFAAIASGPCETVIAADCDHFYNGVEDQISAIVATWLKNTIPGVAA